MKIWEVRDKAAGRYGAAAGEGERGPELHDILPKNDLQKVYGKEIVFEELDDIDMVGELNPHMLFGLAYSVWDRIVKLNIFDFDKIEISDRIARRDPNMHTVLSAGLGTAAIKKIYYAKAGMPKENKQLDVAEFFSARVYPNNLYLSRVEFPLPENTPRRNLREVCRKQMDLFFKVIDNALQYGKNRGCNYLMFNAADQKQVGIFARRGFLLEDRLTEKKAVKLGIGIPMVLQI